MGKRKSEIFTVAESVVNWFEANNHSLIPRDNTNDIANRPKPGGERSGQPNIADVATNDPGITSWPKDVKRTEPPAKVAIPVGTTIEEEPRPPQLLSWTSRRGQLSKHFGSYYR